MSQKGTYGENAESAKGVWVVAHENVHGTAAVFFFERRVEHGVVDLADLVQRDQHSFFDVGNVLTKTFLCCCKV